MSLVRGATRCALEIRADLLARTRAFFAARGVLEVDTPALSPAGATEPALVSLTTRARSLGGTLHYLQTSPEFAMKRLLASGSGDIYQICRVFRDDELGRWHQPEFTLLEWYRLGFGCRELICELQKLVLELLAPYRPPARTAALSYAEAFRAALDVDPHGDCAELGAELRRRGISVPGALDRDALLDLALSTVVAPAFPPTGLTFIYDYPASQAALARTRAGDPPVAERFEAFVGALEIANGFHELGDPELQRRRFEAENAARERRGLAPVALDEDLLGALRAGLPDCAGVAVGFDRLAALACNADELATALAFAHVRT